MREKLDRKFYGELRKAKDDSVVPEDQWVVFLAKDDVFAAMVLDKETGYFARCLNAGCDNEQLHAVRAMEERIRQWRIFNDLICKRPDAAGEKLL